MLDQIIDDLCKKARISKTKLVFTAGSTYVSASTEKKNITIERYKTKYIEGITLKSKNHLYFDIDLIVDLDSGQEYELELKLPVDDACRLKEYINEMGLKGNIYQKMKEKAQKLSTSDDPHYAEMILTFEAGEQAEAADIAYKLLKFKDIDFVKKKKEKKSPKENMEELDIS